MHTYKKENTLARKILLGYFVILCLHFLLDHFAIIYPSLVFPSFSDAHKIEKTIPIKTIELYGIIDNRSIKLSEKDFFGNINYRHSFYILNTISKKEGKAQSSERVRDQRKVFRKYAETRLNKIYPNLHFNSLLINYSNRQYNVNKKVVENKVTNEKRIFIPLT